MSFDNFFLLESKPLERVSTISRMHFSILEFCLSSHVISCHVVSTVSRMHLRILEFSPSGVNHICNPLSSRTAKRLYRRTRSWARRSVRTPKTFGLGATRSTRSCLRVSEGVAIVFIDFASCSEILNALCLSLLSHCHANWLFSFHRIAN